MKVVGWVAVALVAAVGIWLLLRRRRRSGGQWKVPGGEGKVEVDHEPKNRRR